jgi:hypothetical protein
VVSAQGRWFITPHAVRRYVERCRPELSYECALAELVAASETAKWRREVEPGIDEYVGPKPQRWRYRVAAGKSGLPQLLTVIGRGGSVDGWAKGYRANHRKG